MHKLLLPLICAVSLSSCATSEIIARAEGRPGPMDNPNVPPPPPMPAYYALVPVVFPFDAITWPIQLLLNNEQQSAPYPPPGTAPYQRNYQNPPPQQGVPYRP